jgi:hypothetical protein
VFDFGLPDAGLDLRCHRPVAPAVVVESGFSRTGLTGVERIAGGKRKSAMLASSCTPPVLISIDPDR